MPLLFTFFGLRFMFYSNDHEPIHVHVVKGKGKIKRKCEVQYHARNNIGRKQWFAIL